ncbi:Trypsin-1 [Caligus rogercresseyi]|uniref:Trypsin-1 n=3 Tax=Caligus rogercresseyi TaxID=217165 RepID=A0A7T8GU31_CALRO|nr:Trypsin-1 [Caligus rogercresseyi]
MEAKEEKLALVAIDYMKAFNSVDHEWLIKCLERKGFRQNYIRMVSMCLKGLFTHFGGEETAYAVNRGCRQGDPISPFLFILALDPLICEINSSLDIGGVKIGKNHHKVEAFADDLTVLFSGESKDIMKAINNTFKILENYSLLSGLKVNVDKSKAITNCSGIRELALKFIFRDGQNRLITWRRISLPRKYGGLGMIDFERILAPGTLWSDILENKMVEMFGMSKNSVRGKGPGKLFDACKSITINMMKTISAVLLLAAAVSAVPSQRHIGRIVGGEEVEPNSIPFQVSFQSKNNFHFCGGSVLDKDTVITAAHCCVNFRPNDVKVVAGEHDLFVKSGDEQAVNVDQIIYHELYGSAGTNYDVCLLKLKSSLELGGKVKAVSLPKKDEVFSGDLVVSGWGTLYAGGPSSDELRAVTVQVVSDEDCEDAYPGMIDETMICAAAPEKDSCQGDSGGPLVQGNTLVGIVSWGRGCAFAGYPGVYGKVTEFLDWIAEQ